MKNILFGLIATVLFTTFGYSKPFSQKTINHNDVFSIESINNFEDNVGLGCIDLVIGYGYGGFYIEVGTKFCCWRAAAQSPHYDCAFFSTRPGVPIPAYVDVESLDTKILDKINKGDSNKISISNSQVAEYEGKFYKVVDGNYTIENDKYGRFIKVNLVEVNK